MTVSTLLDTVRGRLDELLSRCTDDELKKIMFVLDTQFAQKGNDNPDDAASFGDRAFLKVNRG